MKTNLSKQKVNILQKENKKPPDFQNQFEEKEITSEQEKIYLQGEPHIEVTTADKEIMCPPIDEKLKTEPKQLKVFRPRENYLKEKISKLNYDQKLLNNIQKDLGSQMENIKTQIKEKNILITEVPKDLNKFIIRSASTDNKIIKYSNEDYELKKKHKVIKELKEEQETLKKKLIKIEENEALLNNEGFMNLNNSYDGKTKFDKNLKEQHIKSIKNKKNDINERLKEIDFRIEQLLKEDNFKLTKKEKIQNFKENFERDKEIIEARANKYLKEIKERNQRVANDINNLVEKRKKEIEQKEKDDQLIKEKIRKEFIEKEKAIERKRLKEQEEIMLKYKPFMNVKNDKNEKDYLFGIYDKRYQENEQKLIDKINNEKKKRNKMVTSEELQNFLIKIEEKKEQIKKEKEKRDKNEMEKFEIAKNYKPSYISHFNEMIDEEIKKEKEKSKKEEIFALKELKEEYSKNIREKKQPAIDEILKKQRMDVIVALENPKLIQIKDTLIKQKKNKRIKLKKRDPNKPSKYAWMSKLFRLEDKNKDNLNNSAIIQNKLIKRPKSITYLSLSARKEKEKEKENEKENENKNEKDKNNKKKKKKKENDITDRPIKKIDYLTELRQKRLLTSGGENDYDILKSINKKGKKMKKGDENLIHQINDAKLQVENLDKKAQMEEQLLKYNGGIGNNPEAGKKLSGYIMGSIKTKLNILNQLYKSQ